MSALNQAIQTYAALDEGQVLTYHGSVLGVISLSGVEPNLLSPEEKAWVSLLLRHVIQRLPFEATLTQHYFHYDSPDIEFTRRDNARAQLVSSRRAAFLNHKRELYQSSLFWTVEVKSVANYASLGSEMVRLCMTALFDVSARQQLKIALSNRASVLFDERELFEQCELLDEALDNTMLGLSFRSLFNEKLTSPQIFALQKALVTLQPQALSAPYLSAPNQDWDRLLSSGHVSVVVLEGQHYLKIEHDSVVYARIAAVNGIGMSYTPECAWASDANPALEKGNYLFFTRFQSYSKQGKRGVVKDREAELHRSQLSLMDLAKGEADQGSIRMKIESNHALSAVMRDLERMSEDEDKYGEWLSFVVVFDEDWQKVKKCTKRMKSVLDNSDFHLLWEKAGLLDAYELLLLGSNKKSVRSSVINSSQAGALSLFFRSHEGFPTWLRNDKPEEALYVFESDDGVPFHYTPFVGDKCLVIGVGPTRSGKTFLKQCVSNHFLKLGGMYCAMDIDAGSEPLARFFKDDAALFCLKDTQQSKGFNPFFMSRGQGDDGFVRHMLELVRLMLLMNDAQELQTLTATEQDELESAIVHVMSQDGKLRSFSSMLGKCKPSLNQKLKNFKRGGIYGNLFDNEVDAIGVLNKPFSVYNTEGVKDTPALAQLVNTEIFFRSVRLFEDPQYRTRAKFFEVDEAQYVLSQKGAAEFVIAKARTWFKHGGGMGFWTQSPKHYSDLSEWGTLMSAATTFIFMADAEMKREDYLHAFPFLTQAELDVIGSLKPKQQAFIKQPDAGIAKVINLHVEPEQYVVATSRPHEAALAQRIFNEEPDVDVAVDRIVAELNLG
ncbi:VirB4 family type IV secretion system protein [Vibrio lentus]|uniref:Type IV secretion system protein B4 n=2 Tax=Vibrio TaxID=662 RepID=A0A2N7KP67_9VIBR|nr:VirB4 family type IV secretion system protein [Vibrio lentus]PMM78442.1 type IV secretion system protein B4 [Vibrio lentus]